MMSFFTVSETGRHDYRWLIHLSRRAFYKPLGGFVLYIRRGGCY